MTNLNYLEPWYQALRADLGIVIETDNPKRLMSRLYKARDAANDPELAELSIIVSPTFPESQLWIVKRNGNREPTETLPVSLPG